jgi:hypothetical protein
MILTSVEYVWYCRHCEEELERGETAVACDSLPCPCSGEWGGDPCGYIVCCHCHRPAAEIEA